MQLLRPTITTRRYGGTLFAVHELIYLWAQKNIGRGKNMENMKAPVFHGVSEISIDEVPRPRAGVGGAEPRVTLTAICGADLHIVRGGYSVSWANVGAAS
jgi:hypothetical protein